MSESIHDCLGRVKADHFPHPAAPPGKIDAILSALPWFVPDDLRLFYHFCNGASLFREDDAPFELIPIEDFRSTRIDIMGHDDDKWAPASWFSIAYVQDGNYISIDLSSASSQSADVLDCFHETFGVDGYQLIIAKSFTEFLRDALNSGGQHYWLDKGFRGYGYR